MFVFGGCTDGAPQNSLWQFDFGQYVSSIFTFSVHNNTSGLLEKYD